MSVQLFSSLSRAGVEEARLKLAEWLDFGQKKPWCREREGRNTRANVPAWGHRA